MNPVAYSFNIFNLHSQAFGLPRFPCGIMWHSDRTHSILNVCVCARSYCGDQKCPRPVPWLYSSQIERLKVGERPLRFYSARRPSFPTRFQHARCFQLHFIKQRPQVMLFAMQSPHYLLRESTSRLKTPSKVPPVICLSKALRN